MAYTSSVDIKLAQQPKAKNPEFYEDAIDLYNAVHILNARMQGITNGLTSSTEDVPAWEAMPFNRWVWVTAWEEVKVGQVGTIARGRFRDENNDAYVMVEGLIKGAPYPAGDNFSQVGQTGPTNESTCTGVVGIILDDAEAGGRTRLGIGPAVVQIPGIKRGDVILAPQVVNVNGVNFPFQGRVQLQKSTIRGAIMRLWSDQIRPVVIGSGIDTDAALILPQVDAFSTEYAARFADTPYNAGPTSNE